MKGLKYSEVFDSILKSDNINEVKSIALNALLNEKILKEVVYDLVTGEQLKKITERVEKESQRIEKGLDEESNECQKSGKEMN